VTNERDYKLWFYPNGGEHENDREPRGSFGTLAEAIEASDFPSIDCWDQSTSDTGQLDDPVIEAAGRQYSWLSIDRTPDQTLSDSFLKEPTAMTDPEVREITIDTWAIELDNGENLRDLSVGDAVELHTGTDFDGLWVAKEFSEQGAVITLQAGKVVENCADDEAISCRYSGTRHAHPVDIEGRMLRRPESS
jgi:hypothetical protein